MDIITVIIQAVVQGLTEFLPVSSSGHLSVVQHVTGVNGEAALVLSLVLHLGTLAAVFVAFWGTIWGMIKEFFLTIGDIFTGKFSWKNMNGNRRMMFMVIIATVILVPFYLVEGFFTGRQGDGDIVFEGAAFLFTSLILFLSDRFGHGTRTAEQIRRYVDSAVKGMETGMFAYLAHPDLFMRDYGRPLDADGRAAAKELCQACKALNISPITATATRITAILPAIGQTRAPQCFARRRGFFFFALFMSFPPV